MQGSVWYNNGTKNTEWLVNQVNLKHVPSCFSGSERNQDIGFQDRPLQRVWWGNYWWEPGENWKFWSCFPACYASAFRRRRHYVFGLSVRPSVRPKPEIPSFDLYMGPLVHPTNRNRFTACPSVSPSVRRGFRAFAGERMEGMARNLTCWCILTIFRTD